VTFIITTTQLDESEYRLDTQIAMGTASRYAVATIEEARSHVLTDLGDRNVITGPDDQFCTNVLDLSDTSGGTIAPLPDGTTIDVERVTWSAIADDLGVEFRYDPPTTDGDYLHDGQRLELECLLDVYNARQEG
jgi:hypothetical protein